jgi:NAD(P)-dependent dehydrogenase (short-subunit alcohol dehydrogenase family)
LPAQADTTVVPPVGRLAGRRILLTGGASGIGKATAELFSQEGARLAILDRSGPELNQVCAALSAHPFVVDVTDEAQVRKAVGGAAEALAGLDGVANVAGIGKPGMFREMTLADWNLVLSINLTGPFLICREALRYLEREEGAAIVNVSSGSALLPVALAISGYVASKAGLIAFSKALAYELSPKIRVNVVCPGAVDTPILPDTLRTSANDPRTSPYALKRIADPVEIANGILFLMSKESSFVTGATLAIDGGRTYH